MSTKTASLRTTIPIEFIRMADIRKGDALEWKITMNNENELIAIVKKKR